MPAVIHIPKNDIEKLKEAIPVLMNRGDAIIFDRRLWHTSTPNFSDITRKVIFYGYAYRWIAPADKMTVEKYWEESNPIRKQLLRYRKMGHEFHNPIHPDESALRKWMIGKNLCK